MAPPPRRPIDDARTDSDAETHELSGDPSALPTGDPAVRQRFSRRKLLAAFSQVCLAVDFAHARGVVHRDLKPANIMLGEFGECYVLDWGIAKTAGASDESSGEQTPNPAID